MCRVLNNFYSLVNQDIFDCKHIQTTQLLNKNKS